MDSREEFEKRYPVLNGLQYDKSSDEYLRSSSGWLVTARNLIDYNIRYEVWKAAIAKPIKSPYSFTLEASKVRVMGADDVREAIEAAGYKCE